MLLPLAQTFAEAHPDLMNAWWVIFDIAGVIGLIVILFAIYLILIEIPELMRYLKKSSM